MQFSSQVDPNPLTPLQPIKARLGTGFALRWVAFAPQQVCIEGCKCNLAILARLCFDGSNDVQVLLDYHFILCKITKK